MGTLLSVVAKFAAGIQKLVAWLSSKPNRLLFRGTRVEVMAFILCREPEPMILLGQSSYHAMWMPPQKGVRYKESFESVLDRCLCVECGLQLPEEAVERERVLHLRSITYAGAVDLPTERWGERPVADNVVGTSLESVQVRRKAYRRRRFPSPPKTRSFPVPTDENPFG